MSERHPATEAVLRWFKADHLPDDLYSVSNACRSLAYAMTETLPYSRELTVGLRKLLEAKDAFVRAAVDARSTNTGG